MAAVDARAIYLSTDLGSTWTTSTTLLQDGWCIACSADGRTMLAGDSGPMHGAGQLHLSTNSGATWNVPAGTYGYWRAVASSASGSIFVAGEDNNVDGRGLLYSTNSGDTWVLVGFSLWTSTACSADGTKMFACDYRGISRSSDNGSEWTLATMGPVQAIACSADGTRLIATGGGRVFTSTDCGANWVTNDVLKTNWNPVACSADGSRMYAAVNGGGIYTSQTTPAPVLNISRSGNSVLLSWVIPSTQFALQESADLTAWSGVSVSPVINYTNLHHEVSLLAPLEPKFYRLATP